MNQISQYDFQSFESEYIKVDFISFNVTKLSFNLQTSQIATYFQNLGFNCYLKNLESNKRREGCSNNHFQNKFELNIILNVPYQKEIMQIQFPGLSANQFYQLIKQKSIQWEKLTKFKIVLSRFDLVYERRKKLNDNISNTEFLDSFYLEFTKLYLHRSIISERNQKGLVLKIGNRKGQRYYRLYTSSENNSIRFEAEMKGDLIKKYHDFLTASNFDQQDFESQLLYEFFKYSFEIFRLSSHTSHVDWLINRIRPFQYKGRMISSEPNIHLHYLNQLDFYKLEEKQYLINFLKLIGFVRGLKYNTKKLKSTYRQFCFPLRDFLKYTNKTCNQYQLNKLKGFFDLVSKNFVIESFTDTEYRMLVSIPDVHIYKSEQNIWNVEIWIAEELFDYLHPFLFQDLFSRKLTKDQFQVLFEVIKVYSSVDVRKEFNIQNFLDNYPSTLNSQRKKKIRQYFVHLLLLLNQQQQIRQQVIDLSSNESFHINQLDISHSNIIVFENIDVKFIQN